MFYFFVNLFVTLHKVMQKNISANRLRYLIFVTCTQRRELQTEKLAVVKIKQDSHLEINKSSAVLWSGVNSGALYLAVNTAFYVEKKIIIKINKT